MKIRFRQVERFDERVGLRMLLDWTEWHEGPVANGLAAQVSRDWLFGL